MDAGAALRRAALLLSRASSTAAAAASSASPFCLAQNPCLPCLPPESLLFLPKNRFFFLPPCLLLAPTPSLLALMEEAWPALGPTVGDAAFRPRLPPAPLPRHPWRGARPRWPPGDGGQGVVHAGGEPDRVQLRQLDRPGPRPPVVDANAAISLASTAGRLVTMREVLEEVRDAAALWRLALLPTPVETIEQESRASSNRVHQEEG
ncbi:hypothetical protein ACQJBY_052306 [Aegilops geniculata]